MTHFNFDQTTWNNYPKPFSYAGVTLEIIKFCKPSIKARLDYIEWSKKQNDKH